MGEPNTPTTVTPPLGDIREGTSTCGYGNGACDRPATWHLFWTPPPSENSHACDHHAELARKEWAEYDRHPITDMCLMPAGIGIVHVWSWEQPPGRCIWQIEDDDLAAEANAEAPVPFSPLEVH